MNTITMRTRSDALRRLLRKVRRDAWDDAVEDTRKRGYISRSEAVLMKAANPAKGSFG